MGLISIVQEPRLGLEPLPLQRMISIYREEIKLDNNEFTKSINKYMRELNDVLKLKKKSGEILTEDELITTAWTAMSIYTYPAQLITLKIRNETKEGFTKIITTHPYTVKDPFTPHFQQHDSEEIQPLYDLEQKVSSKIIITTAEIKSNKGIRSKIIPELLRAAHKLEEKQYTPQHYFDFIAYRLASALFNITYEEDRFTQLEEEVAATYGIFLLPKIELT